MTYIVKISFHFIYSHSVDPYRIAKSMWIWTWSYTNDAIYSEH